MHCRPSLLGQGNRVGQEGRGKEQDVCQWRASPLPHPLQPCATQGEEEEEKEEAASGLSEVPSREYRVLDWPPRWGREAEVLTQALTGPRKAEGKVVEVWRKKANKQSG